MVWLMLFPFVLIFELFSIPLAFVLPRFIQPSGHLPWWLRWFDTPDNPTWGDANWVQAFGKTREAASAWLIRNRAYGWKLGPMGCPQQEYDVYGDPDIKNRHSGKAGWLILLGVDWHWYVKCIIPIGLDYCIQIAFGWQLDAPINGRCLYMFSPRITRFYRG